MKPNSKSMPSNLQDLVANQNQKQNQPQPEQMAKKAADHAKTNPPLEVLNKLLRYDPDSGLLHWKIKRNGAIHPTAGYINHAGYVVVTIFKKAYMAHRIAWHIHFGYEPDGQVDHKNRNRSDNRIENLRLASGIQNRQNRTLNKNNSSGASGVNWIKGKNKWRAEIGANGSTIRLGYFMDKESAIAAREKAALKFHGEFASTHSFLKP